LIEAPTEFNEARIAFPLGFLFPGQDLIDLGKNEHSATMIEFRRHEPLSVTLLLKPVKPIKVARYASATD
jgi:hypothetical protein